MLYILIAILAGVTTVAARIINSNLAERIGIFQGTFLNYVTGLFFSSVFMLFSGETLVLPYVKLQSIPIWAYLGGMTGVLVVTLSSYITPKISAFYQTLFVFISQLFVGIIIDYVTLNQLSAGKIVGGLLVLSGLTYNLLVDRKSEAMTSSDNL
jgi:transporter family-2 protein